MPYDYLIVGAGLFGSVFARRAADAGKRVLVIDRRAHIGGNVYTEKVEGIDVHRYGAHIFHTNDRVVWRYVNQFTEFNRFTNSPVANYHGELYSLPFNMYTFNKMWGVVTPEEAQAKIARQRADAGSRCDLLANSARWQAASENCRSRIENGFTIENMVHHFEAEFCRLTEEPAVITQRHRVAEALNLCAPVSAEVFTLEMQLQATEDDLMWATSHSSQSPTTLWAKVKRVWREEGFRSVLRKAIQFIRYRLS